MQVLANALLSELASRAISFLVSTYGGTSAGGEAQAGDQHRLRLLLLRTGMIVEEAERRRVTSRGMLRHLGALRDQVFRGCYVLDTITHQQAGAGRDPEPEEEEGSGRLAFAPSRFNPAKRVRFWLTSGGSQSTVVLRPATSGELQLQEMVRRLEAAAADANELVAFLARCPPLHRQPYSAHLFVDKYMFGRHAERDQAVEFLLQAEPPGAAATGVLPIVGPRRIGKSTFVEHLCGDERVHDHFSQILFYKGRNLEDETMSSFRENCAIKHQNSSGAMDERWLVVIELPGDGDVDDGTWNRLCSRGRRRMPQGSKMILTSRSEKIARLGTTQALRLRCLTTEAFWYFFKLLVFGSTDPDENPGLKSMAMEMALETRGSFMTAYTIAAMLRADFSRQLWRKVLGTARQDIHKNLAVFDEYPDDFKAKEHPWQVGNIDKLDEHHLQFRVYESYQKDSADQAGGSPDPEMTLVDLLSGRARPRQRGRVEILHWKATIPPYFSYISPCDICDPEVP